jgi:aminoglycoside/choline kinase family phosphotransferase
MQEHINAIRALYQQITGREADDVKALPASGSDRQYFRVQSGNQTLMGTYNANVRENETFFYFANHFQEKQIPVPQVVAVSTDKTYYLQEDLGGTSLLDVLDREGHQSSTLALFEQTVKKLAHLQVHADAGLDYQRCITSKEFGKQAILSDLLYFRYYFLDTLKEPYDKEALVEEFDALANYLSHADFKFFLYRDFQSRNVMVRNNNVFFIDFQGGMKGAVQYDLASLLWQARAELSDDWKDRLLETYVLELERILATEIDRSRFVSQYNGYVLIRLLQVLGAYGFRGLFERKAHFLTSIPLALKNLRQFLAHRKVGIHCPELERLLSIITSDALIARFTPIRAEADSPLVVAIQSFSFIKRGYPEDTSAHGGGFVFDCRGILNPGRLEPYKPLTGRDKPVQEFLEQQTRMPEFLNHVYSVVDIAVEDYLSRGFDRLAVNFGCTGGQHRSVYAADALARHLRNKYGVKTQVWHLEQNFGER